MRRRWEDKILGPLGLTRLELAVLVGLMLGLVGGIVLILSVTNLGF